MLKPKAKRAPKKAPVKNRRVAVPRPKDANVICLGPADSQKLADMLSRPEGDKAMEDLTRISQELGLD